MGTQDAMLGILLPLPENANFQGECSTQFPSSGISVIECVPVVTGIANPSMVEIPMISHAKATTMRIKILREHWYNAQTRT